jgi:hypothetical protein
LIVNQLKESDEFWNDLLFNVCEGDAGNMMDLKRMDIFDLFDYIKNYGRRNTNTKSGHRSIR